VLVAERQVAIWSGNIMVSDSAHSGQANHGHICWEAAPRLDERTGGRALRKMRA
jgi:hypothetical protein